MTHRVGLTWIVNYIHYSVELLTHSQTSSWEWMRNFIPHFTGHVITYPRVPGSYSFTWIKTKDFSRTFSGPKIYFKDLLGKFYVFGLQFHWNLFSKDLIDNKSTFIRCFSVLSNCQKLDPSAARGTVNLNSKFLVDEFAWTYHWNLKLKLSFYYYI